MSLRNYQPEIRKNYWFKGVFDVPVGNGQTAITDGCIIFFDNPPWPRSRKRPIYEVDRIEFFKTQDTVLGRFPECPHRIKPLKVIEFNEEPYECVVFDNGLCLDRRYYDAILAHCAKPKFFSDINNAFAVRENGQNWCIEFWDGKNKAGYVKPIRVLPPEGERRPFKRLAITWYGLSWDAPTIFEEVSLGPPDHGVAKWFTDKAALLEAVQERLKSTQASIQKRRQAIKAEQAEVQQYKEVLAAHA